jgi:hypothetical protein
MSIKATTLAALVAAGITSSTPEQELKKAYFKTAGHPLSKQNMPHVLAALNGDNSVVTDDSAAAPAAAKEPKAPKTPKAPKEPKAPVAAKVAETPDAALARLKADPATSARWARVQSILEMGKRGPVRVRIVCDDKGPNGEELTRDIKIQDLFQVKFSAGYKKSRKAAPKAEAAPVAPSTDASPAE